MSRNQLYKSFSVMIITLSVITITNAKAFSAQKQQEEKVRDIGSRRELFIDDYLIERMTGARLQLQKPVMRDVALVHDAPWEGNVCCYHTVIAKVIVYAFFEHLPLQVLVLQ